MYIIPSMTMSMENNRNQEQPNFGSKKQGKEAKRQVNMADQSIGFDAGYSESTFDIRA